MPITIVKCNAFSYTLSNGARVLHINCMRSDGLRIVFPDNFIGYTVRPVIDGWIISI